LDVGDYGSDASHDLGEIETTVNNGVSIISDLVSSVKAGTDVDITTFSRWLWNTAGVAHWADSTEDLLKISADDVVSLLALNIGNEGSEGWDDGISVGDAVPDTLEFNFLGEESTLLEAKWGLDAASEEAFKSWLDLGEESGEGISGVEGVDQRSSQAGNSEDVAHAFLGFGGGGEGHTKALVSD